MEQPPASFLKDQAEYLTRQLRGLFSSYAGVKRLLDSTIKSLEYDIGLFVADTPYAPSILLCGYTAPRAIKISDVSKTIAKAVTAPALATTTILIKVDGVQVVSAAFAVSSTTGVVTYAVSLPYTIASGAQVTMHSSISVDVAISGIGVTLVGTKV